MQNSPTISFNQAFASQIIINATSAGFAAFNHRNYMVSSPDARPDALSPDRLSRWEADRVLTQTFLPFGFADL